MINCCDQACRWIGDGVGHNAVHLVDIGMVCGPSWVSRKLEQRRLGIQLDGAVDSGLTSQLEHTHEKSVIRLSRHN